MDELHKRLLKDNMVLLVEDLEPRDVFHYLLQLDSFSLDDVERIDIEKTRRDRAMMLLSILPRRGPDAFGVFVEALSKKQPHLHKLLMEQDAESCVVSAETSAHLEEPDFGDDLDDTEKVPNETPASAGDDVPAGLTSKELGDVQQKDPLVDRWCKERGKPNGKQIVKALYGYQSCVKIDLCFAKGDIMEILEVNGEWLLAKRLATGETGYIPTNYVAEEGSLETEEWYHSGISRKDAIKALTREHQPDGTFLVRESVNNKGEFTLSVAARDKENDSRIVKHYRIRPMDHGGWYMSSCLKFSTLRELVEQCSIPEIAEGLFHVLSNPCPKSTPTLNDLSHSTRDKWEIERSTIEMEEMIGTGQFAEVHKAKWNKTRTVAVKTLKPGSMSTDSFLAEAQVMKSLTHKNIVQLLAACTEEEPILIVTEYLANGSLLAYLRQRHDNKLPLPTLLDIAAKVADGMAYIEDRKLIHGDLAVRNILLAEDLTPKVTNFSLAKDEDVYEAMPGDKFPVKWTASEAALKNLYTIKSDVWSFGIVLVEIITHGAIPYLGMCGNKVLKKVSRGIRHEKPDDCPDFLYEIMLKCWNKAPENRPKFEYLADILHNYHFLTKNEYEEK